MRQRLLVARVRLRGENIRIISGISPERMIVSSTRQNNERPIDFSKGTRRRVVAREPEPGDKVTLLGEVAGRIWIRMTYELRSLLEGDRTAVVAIFNYFVQHGFAAYPEEPVGNDFFDRILALCKGYPAVSVITDAGEVVGFGFLRAFHPAATFRRTAEVAYFLLPEHTGRGIGNKMLSYFTDEARARGVDNLVASVSSLNEQSLRFHVKTGFERCGRFEAVGRKSGRDFDMIWFQKRL